MLADVKLDKKHDRAKRSSLFCWNMGNDEKRFCGLDAYTSIIKCFFNAHRC
jgi:hypothetical protein